jgi:hypothetical protein
MKQNQLTNKTSFKITIWCLDWSRQFEDRRPVVKEGLNELYRLTCSYRKERTVVSFMGENLSTFGSVIWHFQRYWPSNYFFSHYFPPSSLSIRQLRSDWSGEQRSVADWLGLSWNYIIRSFQKCLTEIWDHCEEFTCHLFQAFHWGHFKVSKMLHLL